MVLEMGFSNFYSIKDEIFIDFRAANINTKKSNELKDNIFSYKDHKILKVQGLFGPNASGKSNILKAAGFCRHLILESHLNNVGYNFTFIPFKFDEFSSKPSTFYIRFVIDEIEYEYTFTLNQNEILKEELYFYPVKRRTKIFTRNEELSNEKSKIYSFGEGYFIKPMDVAQSTGFNTLFISRASQMDRDLAKKIYNFFLKDLVIGIPQLSNSYTVDLFNQNKDVILKVLKMADSDITDIDVEERKETIVYSSPFLGQNIQNIQDLKQTKIIHFFTRHKNNSNIKFDLNLEESEGTIQIFSLLLVILYVCKNGGTLLVDEFDKSLHTELSKFVIDIINASKNSQFLFTTHNTNLMDINKLRRDQILFTNKKQDGSTDLYSLFDFKDFRENMDAEKCYLQGRFDAVPFVNSSLSSIKKIMGA